MPTLIELTDDILDLETKLEASDGEITPDIEAVMESLARNLNDKVDACAGYIRYLEAKVEISRTEAKRYTDRARSADQRLKWLKERLLHFMEFHQVTRLEATRNTLLIAAKGGKRPVQILDEDQVPADFRVYTWSLDKEAIRTQLEDGQAVPGVQLGERGKSLRIR